MRELLARSAHVSRTRTVARSPITTHTRPSQRSGTRTSRAGPSWVQRWHGGTRARDRAHGGGAVAAGDPHEGPEVGVSLSDTLVDVSSSKPRPVTGSARHLVGQTRPAPCPARERIRDRAGRARLRLGLAWQADPARRPRLRDLAQRAMRCRAHQPALSCAIGRTKGQAVNSGCCGSSSHWVHRNTPHDRVARLWILPHSRNEVDTTAHL